MSFRGWTEEMATEHNVRVRQNGKICRVEVKAKGVVREEYTPPKENALEGNFESLAQKKRIVIHLPFALPTWNALLASGIWQRKKIRDKIHAAVLQSCRTASGLQTPME